MRIHFIGICGVSMKRLADICARRGYQVTGSDLALNGHDAQNVHGADMVVYTAAAENNVELLEARRLGIPVLSRAQMLDRVAKGFSRSVAIAGCHGKTTAVGFAGCAAAALNPEIHIGGDVDYDCRGGDDLFITEACEYRRSFLTLTPDVAAVLNVDLDHTDCYRNMAEVFDCFSAFTLNATRCALVNGDDPYCRRLAARNVVTFGLGNCDYRAEGVSTVYGRPCFTLCHDDDHIPMQLKVVGRHNVYNALCAVAAAHICGVPLLRAAEDAAAFSGVKRRFERLGQTNGAQIYTDYAHHPNEIAATVKTARDCGAKRVIVVFEPHTYSRTAALADRFADALSLADEVILTPIFAAREAPMQGVTSQNIWLQLEKNGKRAVCLDAYCAVNAYLYPRLQEGDFVLYTGAGTIDRAARSLLETYP